MDKTVGEYMASIALECEETEEEFEVLTRIKEG